jgi:hypothetical protein
VHLARLTKTPNPLTTTSLTPRSKKSKKAKTF